MYIHYAVGHGVYARRNPGRGRRTIFICRVIRRLCRQRGTHNSPSSSSSSPLPSSSILPSYHLLRPTAPSFTVAHARSPYKQMLKALEYLHSHNLVHRDLKSANVMLTVEGKIKLSTYLRTSSITLPSTLPSFALFSFSRSPSLPLPMLPFHR